MKRLLLWCSLLAAGCAGGGVSQAVKKDLEKTVAAHQEPIQLCYRQALAGNAALEGEIVLKFEIEEGKRALSKVKVDKTTLNEPSLEQCVVQETSELTLSNPPEAKLAVTYPLKFKKIEERDP
jgi:hypothetical protein